MESPQEIWQVESNGQIFESNFDEMTLWINQGSLLRIDRVRKNNLRWIEAGKVPALVEFFNAFEAGAPIGPTVTTTDGDPREGMIAQGHTDSIGSGVALKADEVCQMHPDVPAVYVCETCSNLFCKACPTSYGSSVKVCPFCGAMCKSIVEVVTAREQRSVEDRVLSKDFGLEDFGNALAYPFKFKFSLAAGAIMFMIFSIGQGAVSFGGIFMLSSSIFCFMLANSVTFGVLSTTIENFSQGKMGENFMASFEDFSLWDDVINPFFLSIGVYISSFGPLLAVVLIAVFFLIRSVGAEMSPIESDAARVVTPQLPYAAKSAQQSEEVRKLLNKQADKQEDRVAAVSEPPVGVSDLDDDADVIGTEDTYEPNSAANEEEDFAKLEQMINDSRKAQLESVVGKAPDTVAAERSEMIKQVLGYGIPFLLLGGICLLWGLFYFPAACAVAGYTQSFAATINPAVGIDTIRRLGSYYFKVLLMCLVLLVVYSVINGIIAAALSSFDMPGVGNLPATAIASLFAFYFSVVFSCVLGFAMFKAKDRLYLFR